MPAMAFWRPINWLRMCTEPGHGILPGTRVIDTCIPQARRTPSMSAWRWDESKGELKVLQNLSTIPEGFTGRNRPADSAMHPSGRFVYVTNRSTGTLSGFRIDQSNGTLSAISHAEIGSPSSWSMLFDPGGRWALAAAQLGDEVVVYAVDQNTGLLKQTGQRLKVASPICLRWAWFCLRQCIALGRNRGLASQV